MTQTIHLGVVDVSYSDSNYAPTSSPKRRIGQARRGKANAPKGNTNNQTTGDVAEILEAKYHIMEIFADLHEDLIVKAYEDAMEGALQNLAAGAPPTISVTAQAETDIETRFRQFLSNREMDATATPGVPTRAAMRGVSHRFAHPYARRASRPSFIDTGLYQINFAVWTD